MVTPNCRKFPVYNYNNYSATLYFIAAQSLNPLVQDEDNITISSCKNVKSVDRTHSTTLVCYSEHHRYHQDVCVITCANGSLWEPNLFETDFVGKIILYPLPH